MKKSLLVFLAVAVSLFLFTILIFLFQKQGKVLTSDSYLYLRLMGEIPETPPQGFPPFSGITVREIYRALERAKSDPKVRALYLKISFPLMGWGKAEELRRMVESFRKTGKKVISFVEGTNDLGYYIATAGDKIYTFPGSFVEINGIAAQRLYYKRLFEKWGISAQIFHIGNWKTAYNSYTEDRMTRWEREQLLRLGKGIMDELKAAISKSRKIPPDKIQEFMDNEGGGMGLEFKKSPFFDGVLEEPGVIKREFPSLSRVRVKRYAYMRSISLSPNRIAVVFAEGVINMGRSGNLPLTGRVIGSDTIRSLLKKLERDRDVKAVVLRINSPGGSALASEEIENSVRRLAKKKPVVVSMSSYAASGGYYISAPANKIIAEDLTLTGSIGIIGGKISVGKALSKLGIDEDHVSFSKTALWNSPYTEYDEHQFSLIKRRLRAFYRLFLMRVAKGRGKSLEEVDRLGQGKVYLGKEALNLGLVDGLGGIEKAIKEASHLAGISFYSVEFYPKRKTLWERIVETLNRWNAITRLKILLSQGYYFLPPAFYTFK